MKKSIMMTSILALSGFVAAPTAMADPSNIPIDFACPVVASSGINILSNFGSYIGGYGSETINGSPSSPNIPYFVYSIPEGANIPADLTTGSYDNSGTAFDSTKGVVSCLYTSSANPAFDPITVSYQLTNARGGNVANQTANTISINQYLGR